MVWFISLVKMLHVDLRKYKNKVSHLLLFTPLDFRGFFFIRIIVHRRNCIQNSKQNLSCFFMQIMEWYNNIRFFLFMWQQITARSFKNTLTCNNAHKTSSLHWQKNSVQCLTMRLLNDKPRVTVAEVLKSWHLISQTNCWHRHVTSLHHYRKLFLFLIKLFLT